MYDKTASDAPIFANGAKTAAFSRLFNGEAHQGYRTNGITGAYVKAQFDVLYDYGKYWFQTAGAALGLTVAPEAIGAWRAGQSALVNSDRAILIGARIQQTTTSAIQNTAAGLLVNPYAVSVGTIETIDFAVGRYTPAQGLISGPGGLLGTFSGVTIPPEENEFKWFK